MMGTCEAEKMIALACAISFQLGQTLDADNLSLLSAFLMVLSDQIGLLAEIKSKENNG